MSFTIANDEGVAAVEAFLATNSYLSGGNAPGAQDADLLTEIENAKFIPKSCASPNLFGWWWTLAPFRANARALWSKGCAKKEEKKECTKKEEKKECTKKEEKKEEKKAEDDDDFDPFADDAEADKAAEEQKKKKMEEGKSKKHARKDQAKSILEFDVKGYELEQDWNVMADGIRKIVIEGNTWMDSHEILPIAFGMKKLRMKCVIIDDLTCTEDIFEKIQEAFEEDVQSVDTVSFNKA